MGKGTQALHKLWRFLGSTRLAGILLAALLLASLLASLFPQMPSDPATREPWLAAVRLRFGNATGPLHTLGLFDAYHAPWFLGLLAALLLNTFVCTIQRMPRLWRSLTRSQQWGRPGYRSQAHPQGDGTTRSASLVAKRGLWAQAGSLVSHSAALLLATAVLARPALGWTESGVMLWPGQVYSPVRNPTLAVEAGQLTIERHPEGQPRNYRVPLTIELDGALVTSQLVRINHPLTVRGIAFHLLAFGPAAQVTTPEQTYDLPFNEGLAQEVMLAEAGVRLRIVYQPEAVSPDELEKATLFVEATTPEGAFLGSGTVADGDEIVVQETPIAFSLGHYTTWQISHDPTFGLALAAASLMLAGMLVPLWVPQRRAWPRLQGAPASLVDSGEFDGGSEPLADENPFADGNHWVEEPPSATSAKGEADGQ